MLIDPSTAQIIGALVAATAVVVWRVGNAKAEIVTKIHEVDVKVERTDVKTEDVKEDHDRIVTVEASTNAAHRRLDTYDIQRIAK